MSSDLVKQIENIQPAAWESKMDLIRRTVAAGATNDELDLFFYQARRSGLDPLARQIYYIKRKGKGTIQVGIDGFRLIADRTGAYAGNDDAEFVGTTDDGYPASARMTVYKIVQGQRCPFTAKARWDEYYPGPDQGFQWRKMPHTMLAKCAEALALRKAFPSDLSGLYITEEMAQAGPADTPVYSGPVDTQTGVIDAEVVNEERPATNANVGANKPHPVVQEAKAYLESFQPTQSEKARLDAWKAECTNQKTSWSKLALEAKEAGAKDVDGFFNYFAGGTVEADPSLTEMANEVFAAPDEIDPFDQ